MKRYPETAIWDEVTYLAYHLAFSFDELLDLEHRDRVRFVRRVQDIDQQANERQTAAPRRD